MVVTACSDYRDNERVSDFIEALGGSTSVAQLLQLPMTTVASWKSRNSLPIIRWSVLLNAARERGLTEWDYQRLVSIHSEQPPGSPGQ
jgi:hypothetical protein